MADEKKISFLKIDFSAAKPPVFEEKKGKDYVIFGTDKKYRNNYPQYLIDLYNRSSKHRSLVDGKCEYLNGLGWNIIATDFISNESIAALGSFIASPNEDENLKQLSKKINFDYVRFGGYYLEIIWSEDRKTIASVSHIPFNYLRTNEDKSLFFFTKDWSKHAPEKNEDYIADIPAFDVDNKDARQILAIDLSGEQDVYPLPEYLAAVPYIESDYEVANFQLSNIQNGFSGGYMISFFNGQPTPEQAKEIERKLTHKHTGSDNAGRFVLNFADDKSKGAEVTPLLPNNLDKQFIELNKQIQSEIMIAHRVVNPALFGVKSEGGLANNADELRVAHDSFQARYVQPKQEELEDLMNNIVSINGLPKALNIKPLEPIKAAIDNATRVSVMTQDEIRAELGLEPLNNSVSMTETKFNRDVDNIILDHFASCGVDPSKYEILSTKDLYCANMSEFHAAHDKAFESFAVIDELVEDDLKVLNVLKQNPSANVEQISSATGLTTNNVNTALENLEGLGAIETEVNEAQDVERKLTRDGEDTLERGGVEEIMVKYRYVTRTDVPPATTGSREFCVNMLLNPKLWEKSDIDKLKNDLGTDVWTTRGGWYNNPNTGRRSPQCRHIWQQVIVRETR